MIVLLFGALFNFVFRIAINNSFFNVYSQMLLYVNEVFDDGLIH